MFQEYQRPKISIGGPLTPVVKNIIIINSVIFVLQFISNFSGRPMSLYLGLTPVNVIHDLQIWQLFTYMFLHGSFFHILINMLVFWMFGGDVEYRLGSRRFTYYYLICGAGAGLITALLTFRSTVPVVGASGALYGILLAYGIFFPNRVVLFMMIFPMKVKYMVAIFAGITFMASFSQEGTGISHITHLGGLMFGAFYLVYIIWGYDLAWLQRKIHQRSLRKRIKILKGDPAKSKPPTRTLH